MEQTFHPVKELPKTVRVGPFDFHIVPMDMHKATANSRYGECSSIEMKISIQEEFSSPIKAVDTVLHEISHAIFWAYGLEDGDKEERTVSTFGTAWTQVWRDNPKLLAWVGKWVQSTNGES